MIWHFIISSCIKSITSLPSFVFSAFSIHCIQWNQLWIYLENDLYSPLFVINWKRRCLAPWYGVWQAVFDLWVSISISECCFPLDHWYRRVFYWTDQSPDEISTRDRPVARMSMFYVYAVHNIFFFISVYTHEAKIGTDTWRCR